MSVFPSAKYLVSWAGCCPRNDQSNQKIKSTRISRAGSYFKPVLVQVANALIKSKKHPEFTTRYKRIKARRGHKKAIIAICRMILTAIWHILTDLKPYTSEGFLESRPVKGEKILSASQALNLLRQHISIVVRKMVFPYPLDATNNTFPFIKLPYFLCSFLKQSITL